jgi:tripartite-type tricarboxylate transporter receptor subunit TctC
MTNTSRSRRIAGRAPGWLLLLCLVLALAACGDDADDGDVADPGDDPADVTDGDDADGDGDPIDLEGETIRLVVGFSPGGGFDQQARAIADVFSDQHNVTMVVENETGAGGLNALNNHEVAEPDSLRVMMSQTASSVASQLVEADGVRFDMAEWPHLGRLLVEPQLVVASDRSGFTDPVEAMQDAPRIAVTGPGGVDYLHAKVLPIAFGTPPFTEIPGFDGTAEAVAALLRGDADLYALSERSLLPNIEDGDLEPLMMITPEPSENLPDVPLVLDLLEGEPGEQIMRDHIDLLETGRMLSAVPGTSQELVDTLAAMFEETLQSDELVEAFEAQGAEVVYLDQQAANELMQSVLTGTDEEYLEVLREAFGG